MKKTILLCGTIILCFCMMLTGCNFYDIGDNLNRTDDKPNNNSNGGIYVEGEFLAFNLEKNEIYLNYHEGWVFIGVSEPDVEHYKYTDLYRVRPNGTEKQKLCQMDWMDSLRYSKYFDGWIYYSPNSELFRMRLDGSENTKINTVARVLSYFISGEWIFYQTTGILFRIKNDGSDNQAIAMNYHSFRIEGESLFLVYQNVKGAGKICDIIYRCNLDGSEKTTVYEETRHFGADGIDLVLVTDDYLFCTKGKVLIRIKLDDSDILPIALELNESEYLYSLTLNDDFIYYQISFSYISSTSDPKQGSSKARIYKIRIDGTDNTELTNTFTNWRGDTFCLNDSVYYTSYAGFVSSQTNTLLLNRLAPSDEKRTIYSCDRNSNEAQYCGRFIHENELYLVIQQNN